MPRSLEDFELLNTASQLRRAAVHAFDVYRGAIPQQECLRVVEDSHELLGRTARITHHLVPLAERWAIERLRRYAILNHRLAHAVPEILFIDDNDAISAPIAAALLSYYARGRVHVASAGHTPHHSVESQAVEVLAHTGIDARDAFPKPITDDAVHVADVVITLGAFLPLPEADSHSTQHHVHWDIPHLHGHESSEVYQAHRDDLDRRVLLLLADLLTPSDPQ